MTGDRLHPLCEHMEDEHGFCFECSTDMVTARGGKREGAGRPKALIPSTKQIKVLVTEDQHAKFLELGGAKWIKELINNEIQKRQGKDSSE